MSYVLNPATGSPEAFNVSGAVMAGSGPRDAFPQISEMQNYALGNTAAVYASGVCASGVNWDGTGEAQAGAVYFPKTAAAGTGLGLQFWVVIDPDKVSLIVGAACVFYNAGDAGDVKITVGGTSTTIHFAFGDGFKTAGLSISATGTGPQIVKYELTLTSAGTATGAPGLTFYLVQEDFMVGANFSPPT